MENKIYIGTSVALTAEHITRSALSIDVNPAALKAVIEVEAAGKAFNADGSLTMLYEPHIAYRYAPSEAVQDDLVDAGVAARAARAIPYPGRYAARYEQFETCARIGGLELACLSTSWGLPQGMGFNFKAFGYRSATEMVTAFAKYGEPEQIDGMCRFIAANPVMHRAMRDLNWRSFARSYNGPEFAKNRYDTRLSSAFLKHNKDTVNLGRVLRYGHKGKDVEFLQTLLQRAGYDIDADGHFGKVTFAAVTAYQSTRNLDVDGIVGSQTALRLINEKGTAS